MPLASAKTPAAPSGLKVKAIGVNSFLVEWKDNSKNEAGWEIRVALKGQTPQRFVLIPTPDIESYTVTTNDIPGQQLDFQMTAYTGKTGKEVLSQPSSIVTVKALSTSKFEAPTGLQAATVDDGQVRLTWKDNATSENGYQIETRVGSKKWAILGNVGPGISFSILTSGFAPEETRSFRTRAFRGASSFTAYSNVATATTKAIQAPSGLVATTQAEGAFSFKWKDRSSAESGVEIQAKSGSGNFESLGTVGTNVTTTSSVTGFIPDTAYQFRVRAFRTVGATKTYSGFSNVFAIRSTPLEKPITLAGTAPSDTAIILTWVDRSAWENGYEILYRPVGTTAFSGVLAAANAQTVTIANLEAGLAYEFRVSAIVNGTLGNRLSTSAYKSVQVRTREGLVGNFSPPILAGSAFLYPIQVSLPSAVTGVTVTGLPDGLTYNSSNGTITGALTTGGIYSATLTVSFTGGGSSTRTLSLRSVSPSPLIVELFAAATVPAGTSKIVSINGKFYDPDTSSAARVNTTLGTFDIILFTFSTPATVDNFIDYLDSGEFVNSFFHRAPVGFVVQGGGFKHTSAGGFAGVTKFARTLFNEPGLSNVRGTVAMAKLPGLPNSATSEFFVNVGNNAANLDSQNGGFTVFGRVPAAGMVVIDKISALPVKDYTVTVAGSSQLLEDVPVNAPGDPPVAPAILDPAQLVKITSVGPAPILVYQATSQNPAVATASLNGTDLTITGVAAGITTIQIRATDLDGNQVSQNLAVTVP